MPQAAYYFTETTAPAIPPAGKAALYVKSDGLLYWKDDTGTEYAAGVSAATSAAWPVGSIFMSILSTNPATLLGIGTWTRFGTGRMLISQDSGDPDFDVAEETGGAKTHVQTTAELAQHSHTQDAHTHTQNSHNHTQDSHNHTQNSHNHTQDSHAHSQDANTVLQSGSNPGFGASSLNGVGGTTAGATATNQAATATNQATTATNQAATATNQNTTATNQNTGSSSAMNIMNPYIVVYMWKRTA